MDETNIVVLENITKRFPGVVALDNVNLTLKKGSVHALVGENGAGKSTLMKILSGTYKTYEGKIFFEGSEIHFKSERDAMGRGISIVPQEFSPIPELTIEENIFMGREPTKKIPGFIDRQKRRQLTKEFLEYLDLDYNPQTKMSELSVAQIQMVEIIKAISRSSKVIIMDEPTSALTSVETKFLFKQINILKNKGISIVFISHKLEEVYEVCDTVTVLRDGKYISSKPMTEVSQDELISMMVGREIKDIYPPVQLPQDDVMLEVKNLTSKGVFNDISFHVNKGEILGFAGMMGAGRSEIVRSIFGLDPITSGEIYLEGKKVPIKRPIDAIRCGIAMVTEDRVAQGFVGVRSIKENIALPNSDIFIPKLFVKQKLLQQKVTEIFKILEIKAPSIETNVGTLSGGNQQKVVLSKWLIRNVKVLIMDEPTRGIDVGAKQEIYRLISRLASQGLAVIMISSEMPEVLAMSHRVLVISEGKIAGELSREEATQDKVMKIIIKGGSDHGNN